MEFHKDIYEKIGNSSENIKIIRNFLSDQECKDLISLLTYKPSESRPVQFDGEENTITFLHKYQESTKIANQYVERVKGLVDSSFDAKTKFRHAIIKQWEHFGNAPLHINDLGMTDHNNIYTCIYLNEDYGGGELFFPTQGVEFKPKTGDLIMFPASAHYRYVVKNVLGSRYVVPIWFDFNI